MKTVLSVAVWVESAKETRISRGARVGRASPKLERAAEMEGGVNFGAENPSGLGFI